MPGRDRRCLEEGGGCVVEVVGRLVQEQRGGPPDEQRGQGQPAALPAGKGAKAPVVFQCAQAEAVQDPCGAAVGVPGLPVLGPFQASAVGVQEFGVSGVVLGDAGQLLAEPVKFGEVLAGFAQRLLQYGGKREVRVDGHLLVEEAEVAGAGDASRVGFVDAGEQPQQGGLADAVLPDQADAVAG